MSAISRRETRDARAWPAHFKEVWQRTNEYGGMPGPKLRKAAERIAQAYGLIGECDPPYIANVIALHLGIGDGQSLFWGLAEGSEDDA